MKRARIVTAPRLVLALIALAAVGAGAVALAVPADNGAFQCLTASSPQITGLPSNMRALVLQNLGPNDVYVGITAAKTTTALGVKVPTGGGTISIDTNGLPNWFCRAATADQVSPADLRWLAVTGESRP